jgi:hypothetical protein
MNSQLNLFFQSFFLLHVVSPAQADFLPYLLFIILKPLFLRFFMLRPFGVIFVLNSHVNLFVFSSFFLLHVNSPLSRHFPP